VYRKQHNEEDLRERFAHHLVGEDEADMEEYGVEYAPKKTVQRRNLPSVKDPKLWLLKCKVTRSLAPLARSLAHVLTLRLHGRRAWSARSCAR